MIIKKTNMYEDTPTQTVFFRLCCDGLESIVNYEEQYVLYDKVDVSSLDDILKEIRK